MSAVVSVCVAGLIAVLAAGPASARAFTIVVTETEIPLVPNSVLQLAKELGYFERAGVDVELLRATGSPLAVAALLSREGEMANISIEALLALWRQGQTDVRAVSAPAKPIPYVLVATSAITSVEGLAGRTFGIGQAGTLDATLTERLLAAHGVDKSVKMVGIGPPVARVKALAAGRIDATTVSLGTWATMPDKRGLHVLVDRGPFDAVSPSISKVNVVLRDTLAKRRDDIVKVTAALMRLSRDLQRDPRLWGEAMARANTRVSAAELARLAEVYRNDWCADDCFDRDGLIASIRLVGGHAARSIDVDAMADFSIAAQARTLVGRADTLGKAAPRGN